MNALYQLSRPLEIVQAAIFAARTQFNPPSLIIVASPESGKSQVLLYYRNAPTLRYYSNITSKPLLELKPEIESGRVTHLVFQDLCSLTAHQPSVSQRVTTYLAMLMDEGANTFADAGKTIEFRGLPKIGVIAAITPSVYYDKRTYWYRTGFLSRFLPIAYTYSNKTVEKIHDMIERGVKLPDPGCINLPDKKIEVTIQPDIAEAIRNHVEILAKEYNTHGFRYHKLIRSLCAGNALAQGRNQVTEADIVALSKWLPFFSDQNPIEL